MKFLIEQEERDAFEELKNLREIVGDDLILDEMIEELSYQRLEEFVDYIKRKYKSVISEWEPLNDEED